MRTIQFTTNGPSRLNLTLRYPNSIAFMYSRLPVIAEAVSDPGTLPVEVTVTHTATGNTHTERRSFHDRRVEFDISRVMQLLAPDIDGLFRRLDYSEGKTLSEAFTLNVSYTDTDGESYSLLTNNAITAMYGALDQGEIYGEHTQRRLWVNFPQTFNLWKDANNEVAFVLEDAYVYPDIATGIPCGECDLVGTLRALDDTATIAGFLPGRPMRNVGLTWNKRIEKGQEIVEEFRTVTLIPEDCKPSDGTYLRWLNRRGEVSYWLFRNSEIRVTSAMNSSFARYYPGDPAEVQDGSYVNSSKADYREAREMVLGAVGLSRDEYEDLCDLAVSPLVERLMPAVPEEDTEVDLVYDGGHSKTRSNIVIDANGTTDSEVDGGNARTGARASEPYIWQRVIVAAGTHTRGNRRDTPNRQDLEFVIELPERNTARL